MLGKYLTKNIPSTYVDYCFLTSIYEREIHVFIVVQNTLIHCSQITVAHVDVNIFV